MSETRVRLRFCRSDSRELPLPCIEYSPELSRAVMVTVEEEEEEEEEEENRKEEEEC